MTDRTYSVPDITCDHCKQTIESEVGKVVGVEQVTVDVSAKSVSVHGEAPDEAVRAAIEEAGYDIAGVSA